MQQRTSGSLSGATLPQRRCQLGDDFDNAGYIFIQRYVALASILRTVSGGTPNTRESSRNLIPSIRRARRT